MLLTQYFQNMGVFENLLCFLLFRDKCTFPNSGGVSLLSLLKKIVLNHAVCVNVLQKEISNFDTNPHHNYFHKVVKYVKYCHCNSPDS